MFDIRFLDQVAIRVADIGLSVKWYEEVLGMTKYSFKAWGSFPVFMLKGKCGVAIFPSDPSLPAIGKGNKGAKIDHFAFNRDRENFERAKAHCEKIGIDFYM